MEMKKKAQSGNVKENKKQWSSKRRKRMKLNKELTSWKNSIFMEIDRE